MTRTKLKLSEIEVDARNLKNQLDAFRLIPQVAHKILVKHQLGTLSPNGQFVQTTKRSVPLEAFLASLNEIGSAVGEVKMFSVGKEVPRNAPFPPGLTDIHKCMQSVDVAYHMNHLKDGEPMFDPASGTMTEGIGHYRYHANPGENRITLTCDNPYPCDFDRGIVSTFASRFEPGSRVEHANEASCRKRGAAQCVYVISW